MNYIDEGNLIDRLEKEKSTLRLPLDIIGVAQGGFRLCSRAVAAGFSLRFLHRVADNGERAVHKLPVEDPFDREHKAVEVGMEGVRGDLLRQPVGLVAAPHEPVLEIVDADHAELLVVAIRDLEDQMIRRHQDSGVG